jgi:ankyrin repeat protein
MTLNRMVTQVFIELSSKASEGLWEDIDSYIDLNPEIAKWANEYSETLLIILAGYPGSNRLLKKLIELGADVNKTTAEGETALTTAILGGSVYGLTTLPEMEVLLKSGAHTNFIGPSGNPPLHWAVVHNRPDHAKLLIRYGADPSMKTADLYPEDAFEIAKKNSNQILIDILNESTSR